MLSLSQMRDSSKNTISRRSQRIQSGDDDSADVQIGNMSDMSIIIPISANDVISDTTNVPTRSSSSLTTCELCSKRFVKQMLKYHLRSHDSTGKPFQCSHGCPQMFFATSKELGTHIGIVHNVTSNVNEKTRLEKSSKLATSVIPSENSNGTDPKVNTRNLRRRHDSIDRAPLPKRRRRVKKKTNGVRSIRTTQTVQEQLKMERPDTPPAKRKKVVEPSRRSRRCQLMSGGNEENNEAEAISDRQGGTDQEAVANDQEMSSATSSATMASVFSTTADYDDSTTAVAAQSVEPEMDTPMPKVESAKEKPLIVMKSVANESTASTSNQPHTKENTSAVEHGEIVVLVQKSVIPRPQLRPQQPCQQTAPIRSNRRAHTRLTARVKCTVCGVLTSSPTQHMILHDSNRPYQCTDGCVQRFFITESNLRGHRRDVHNFGNNAMPVLEQQEETSEGKAISEQEMSLSTSATTPESSATADTEVPPCETSPTVERMIHGAALADAKEHEVDTSLLGSAEGESSKSGANELTANGERTGENTFANGEIAVPGHQSAPRPSPSVLPRRPGANHLSLTRPDARARTRSPTISLSSDDEEPIRMTMTDVKNIERQRKIGSVRQRRRLPSLFGSTSSLPSTSTSSAAATPSKSTSLPVKLMPATPTTTPMPSSATSLTPSATPSSPTPMITSNNVNVSISTDSPLIVEKKKKRSLVQISMHKFLYATSRKKVPPKPEKESSVIIVED